MKLTLSRTKTLTDLKSGLELREKQMQSAIEFLSNIQSGRFSGEVPPLLINSPLGNSLLSVSRHLQDVALIQQQQNWINTGIAGFADILRNKDGLQLNVLANDIIKNLVEYVQANQGAILLVERTNGDQYLTLLSSYAYGRRKYISKRIEIGEGLAGQCVLEKNIIYIKKVPADYIKITSGLGEATPREVFLVPLMVDDDVYGVIELASFKEFENHKIEYLRKAADIIAASIKTIQENEKVRELLTSSQQQGEELRAQEEEMRQNMEELQATQEEMERKSREILRSSAEMKSIMKGINSTMATIEFTPDGIIVGANEKFLDAMSYSAADIKGRHHRIFVPEEIVNGDEYAGFWEKLRNGKAMTGLFERISATGKRIWLNAIYTPIFDDAGNVLKVVKFATDVTKQQELIAETRGILNGVNVTMATVEFTPDGLILTANDNFLKTMKQRLDGIRGKHHRIFVPGEIADSDDYKSFWRALSEGKPSAGIFIRIDSEGNEVWLNAIYSPITDATGKVTKVVKLATQVPAPQG